ncbi:PLP-dependent aminotransferase family protein [Sulfolobus acidocaldarius]|uniref:Aminotransferase n=4 Tax=Sulfolobus acidocaldarius TaxID=2285 RepID=Q4JA09_SULAC|nr:PLP-dependent aminotransferase family protein [Sulfolobus acidocaldarius]AAY80371.1 aminotransferase [Sulfolobus acidocaldarius DSM 639]AGE70954.1 aminotransferase [Sulfolobus acidocaldarius N8]AGE73225.1 aminotransferase [Sulfolobus acidocaldarius Ron12/I]ALU28741.1 GntR family transcriptional regulator [Sulfolobus acidocaldarius]ALU31461.1 GntR family transcriptional regulator [Sulfolobus acidocaldarius]
MVSRIGKEIELSPVEMGSQIAKKVEINLASGTPDPRLMPIKEIRQAYDEVLEEFGSKVLFYPGAGGQEELKKEIENNFLPYIDSGIKGNVVVTSGAQHAVELLAKYFLEDDTIAVENPTFIETFTPLKLRSNVVLPVSLDEGGIKIDELELLLKVGKIRLLYVIPNCHNPAGVTMCEERRKILVELADKYDFCILEDDPYKPIAGVTPMTIKSLDRNGRVIYISSFSKIIAPGLRVGFIVSSSEEVSNKISLIEQMDFSTSTINQFVIARLLKKGIVRERMKNLHSYYKEKMKTLIDSLHDKGFKDFNEPQCGFFLLLDLKKDSWKVFNEAVKLGLSFVPAKPFYLRGGETMARLSISVATEEQIKEGVKRLRDAWIRV